MTTTTVQSQEPNYYQVLGVTSQADPLSLRRAFHRLTKLYHPDRNPAHSETFKEISRAYRVLSDPAKRREYDLKLHYRYSNHHHHHYGDGHHYRRQQGRILFKQQQKPFLCYS